MTATPASTAAVTPADPVAVDPVGAEIPSPVAAPPRQPTSAARIAANRRNAAKSTGPRTAEGKAQSRRNALKHGLAGEGICLMGEDEAVVRERCLLLHEEMAPTTLRGMMLVEAIAIAHTRMKRAVRQEVAVLNHHQRHAAAAFDDARLTQAEDDLYYIGQNTRTRYRHLIASPEGIDLLIGRLGDVRREIRNPLIRWNYVHGQCLENFCGRDYCDRFTRSRGRALSLALEFDPSELTTDDRHAIAADYQGRIKDWAIVAMEAYIDGEIAHLHDRRAALDHAALARDRAEAADRALFDPSREAALARRYEAAATRTLFRAAREYHDIEGDDTPVTTADLATTPTTARPDPAPDAPPSPRSTSGPAQSSVLDAPSPGVAATLAAGDALVIVDPADRAAPPPAPRRSFEPRPLGSSGISAQQASDELSYPHADRPPIPVHRPIPPLVAVLPPLPPT